MPLFTSASLRGTFDLSLGVPLGRARYVFGSDYWLNRLAEAKNSQAEYRRKQAESAPHDIWRMQASIDTGASDAWYAEGELEDALHKALCSGEDLFAEGCVVRNGQKEPPGRILTSRWPTLELNFESSSAHAPGIEIVDIKVFLNGTRNAERSPLGHGRFSLERARKWYRWYVGDCVERGHEPTRHADEVAAAAALGEHVPRETIRALRREMAPREWTRRGRRSKKASAR